MKLLILDDDLLQLEIASAAVEACGYEDLTATADATSMLADIEEGRSEFDTFLVDIVMPDIDGIEVCRRIRQSRIGANALILMMTARSDRSCIDGAFTAGADDYIIKPFDAQEIANRLDAARHRRRSFDQVDAIRPAVSLMDDDVSLHGVAGLTDPVVMETYLNALDRGRAALSMATGFQVRNWSAFASVNAPDAQNEILRHVVKVICGQLASTTFVLSYFGQGTFICITKRADPTISAGLARRLAEMTRSVSAEIATCRHTTQAQFVQGAAMDLVHEVVVKARAIDDRIQQSEGAAAQLPDLFSN